MKDIQYKKMYSKLIRLNPLEASLLTHPQVKTVDEAKVNYCLHICKYLNCKDEFNLECNILKPFMDVFEYMLEGKADWKYEGGKWLDK